MTGRYVEVPAALSGQIAVLVGPRLLAGVVDGTDLAGHRARWPHPAYLDARELQGLAASVDVRGRGGAAFPFARKLATVIASGKNPAVVVNASEGEPGSAKDSALMLTVPHLVLDGAAVAARALGVSTVHLVIPGERPRIRPTVERAVAGVDTEIEFTLTETSGGFVGGQARAVLELLSGRENLPVTAWAPEAVSGLRGRPTLLSNAETYAQIAVLTALGSTEYARYGIAEEPGTTLLTVGGDGATGAVVEVPLGVRLAEVLAGCGYHPGPVVMGGYHGAWLTTEQVGSARVTRADLLAAGAALGAGVVLPVHQDACPVELTSLVVGYLAGQSARRCGPCRNGLPALARACADLAAGAGGEATFERIDHLVGLLPGRGACAHPDGTVRLVRSLLRAFPEEVAMHLLGECGRVARGHGPALVPGPAGRPT